MQKRSFTQETISLLKPKHWQPVHPRLALMCCIFAAFMGLLIGSSTGCQQVHDFFLGSQKLQSPSTQPSQPLSEIDKFRKDLTIANDTYTTTLDLAMKAAQAGWISKDRLKMYEQDREIAKSFLDEASQEALKPDTELELDKAQVMMKSFWAAYYKYMEVRNAKATATSPTSALQPINQPVTPTTSDRPNFVPDQP